MLEEVVCHIGMHKTGSSSIQATLNKYDDGESFYVDIGDKNHGMGIYTLFSRNFLNYKYWTRRGYGDAKIQQIKNEYMEKLTSELEKPRKRAILSGEDISWLSSGEAENMVSFFLKYARTVKVVCYVRDPKSFVASSLQERIKIGMDHIPNTIDPKYKFRLEKFAALDGLVDLVVRKFDPESLVGGSVVSDFCSIAGVKTEGVEELNKNPTMPRAALSLLYLFNRSCPVFHGDEIVLKAKKRLIKELRQKFSEWPKIRDVDVVGLVATSELGFLEQKFGIKYDVVSELTESNKTPDDARVLLESVSDEAEEALVQILEKYNIKGDFPGPRKKINRLYMHYVHLESSGKAGG